MSLELVHRNKPEIPNYQPKIKYLDSVFIALHLQEIRHPEVRKDLRKEYDAILNYKLILLASGLSESTELHQNNLEALNLIRLKVKLILSHQKENDERIELLKLRNLNLQDNLVEYHQIKKRIDSLINYTSSIKNIDTQTKLITEFEAYFQILSKDKNLLDPYEWIVNKVKSLDKPTSD